MDFSARLIRKREFICNVIPGAFGILGGTYEQDVHYGGGGCRAC